MPPLPATDGKRVTPTGRCVTVEIEEGCGVLTFLAGRRVTGPAMEAVRVAAGPPGRTVACPSPSLSSPEWPYPGRRICGARGCAMYGAAAAEAEGGKASLGPMCWRFGGLLGPWPVLPLGLWVRGCCAVGIGPPGKEGAILGLTSPLPEGCVREGGL